ncbi:hypothetical protein BT69DRAFT_562473 [Atractiella rhizophila]|nr:hypothetical protein BT69DRAFT_562473 [Atractiella rhizophila]
MLRRTNGRRNREQVIVATCTSTSSSCSPAAPFSTTQVASLIKPIDACTSILTPLRSSQNNTLCLTVPKFCLFVTSSTTRGLRRIMVSWSCKMWRMSENLHEGGSGVRISSLNVLIRPTIAHSCKS